MMRSVFLLFVGSLSVLTGVAADFRITSLGNAGALAVTNSYDHGVVAVLRAPAPTGPWTPVKNTFSLGPEAQLNFAPPGGTSFFRAWAVDLSGGSWLLSVDDILDLGLLADELVLSLDPVSAFLADQIYQISPATLDLLNSYGTVPDADVLGPLVATLNVILQGPSIYDTNRFANVTLSSSTRSLLGLDPQGASLIRLNRMLLDDAYPTELLDKQDTGFTNLVQSYGLLTTIAGSGISNCTPCNDWQASFEGGPATNAALSHPHIAMADRAGNIYIADKEAHGIRKVTPDGRIFTVAGINLPGFGDTNPAPATTVALRNPNGLWVREDGTFYILDTGNGLVRKVATNGMMTTLVNNGGPINGGRGFWVSPDESVLYFADLNQLKTWDTTNGLSVFATGFYQLGNLAVDPAGRLFVTDRGAYYVYRLASDGSKTIVAGTGFSAGGGDGYLATETFLNQVRGIWFLPTGAYFLATDIGSQVWYVDTTGFIHLFLNGQPLAHSGDGSWFYDPATPKVSAIRQITMDYDGNLIVTENDAGYIRKVQFLRHQP